MRFTRHPVVHLLLFVSMAAGCTTSAPDEHCDAAVCPTDSCDPACHYDCAGGPPVCREGTLTFYGSSPRPCCGPGSSSPGDDICATGTTLCPSGSCGAVDARYQACLQLRGPLTSYPSGDTSSYFELLCAHPVAVGIGSPCTTDHDCRPAPEGVEALHCDGEVCALAARPTAPAAYGLDCGLAETSLASLPAGESTTYGLNCTTCQVFSDGAGCTKQRCTMGCFFDEDCPSGSICLCSPYAVEGHYGYCAPATDRTTPAGRFGDTQCP